jgi:hypothetical protein
VVAWGVRNFKDFTILSLEYFLHIPGSHNNYQKKKIFIITKIPPLMRGLSKVNRQTGMSATTTLSTNGSNVYLFCGINDLEGF